MFLKAEIEPEVEAKTVGILLQRLQLCEVAESKKLRFDLKSALQVHTYH